MISKDMLHPWEAKAIITRKSELNCLSIGQSLESCRELWNYYKAKMIGYNKVCPGLRRKGVLVVSAIQKLTWRLLRPQPQVWMPKKAKLWRLEACLNFIETSRRRSFAEYSGALRIGANKVDFFPRPVWPPLMDNLWRSCLYNYFDAFTRVKTILMMTMY